MLLVVRETAFQMKHILPLFIRWWELVFGVLSSLQLLFCHHSFPSLLPYCCQHYHRSRLTTVTLYYYHYLFTTVIILYHYYWLTIVIIYHHLYGLPTVIILLLTLSSQKPYMLACYFSVLTESIKLNTKLHNYDLLTVKSVYLVLVSLLLCP
jgi:hypothetical protein